MAITKQIIIVRSHPIMHCVIIVGVEIMVVIINGKKHFKIIKRVGSKSIKDDFTIIKIFKNICGISILIIMSINDGKDNTENYFNSKDNYKPVFWDVSFIEETGFTYD